MSLSQATVSVELACACAGMTPKAPSAAAPDESLRNVRRSVLLPMIPPSSPRSFNPQRSNLVNQAPFFWNTRTELDIHAAGFGPFTTHVVPFIDSKGEKMERGDHDEFGRQRRARAPAVHAR